MEHANAFESTTVPGVPTLGMQVAVRFNGSAYFGNVVEILPSKSKSGHARVLVDFNTGGGCRRGTFTYRGIVVYIIHAARVGKGDNAIQPGTAYIGRPLYVGA